MEQILLSVRETAGVLGIGRTKLYELIGGGQLETVKIGTRRLVRISSVREIAEGGLSGTTRP
ncbi:MAG: DNA-binding protein [Verrucomicrobiaceae bacterium]|nr:MAG: DNA-binding protein [Verrucomicrobiaceae bacterium]